MRFLILTLILFFSVMAPMAHASVSTVRFDRLSIEDGLSIDSIRCILQDQKGFLWIGTGNGLNRYDGYEFKVFRHDPQDPQSISESQITALHEDSNGVLWIGTKGGGLNRYNVKTGRFDHFRHHPSDPHSLSNDIVRSIHEDNQGILWFGTSDGLNRYDKDKQQFVRYQTAATNPSHVGHDITAITEDQQGVLWLGTFADGLRRFDAKNQRFVPYRQQTSDPYSLSHNSISTLNRDKNGTLWIGTQGGGLNQYDSSSDRFIHLLHQPDHANSLSNNNVLSVHEDVQGRLWVGTSNGLNRYDSQTGRFTHFNHSPSDLKSLSNDYITALYLDATNVLWIGTDGGGVNKYQSKRESFGHFNHQPANPDSLSHNTVLAIYKDSKETLWVGTRLGLNRYDADNQRFVHFKHDPDDANSLSHNSVRVIYEDNQGTLWVGTDNGLNRFDANTGQFTHFRHQAYYRQSLTDDRITAIYQDNQGILWIGTRGGLNQYDPISGQFTRFKHQGAVADSLSYDRVTTIFQDSQHRLWVGTSGGLNRYQPETKGFVHYRHKRENPDSLSHDMVTSIFEDSKGIIWVGTYGGLNRFEPQREAFVHYRGEQGLIDDSVYGILEDEMGLFWLSTDQGISQFDPTTETFKNHSVKEGLQSSEYNLGAYFKSADSEMFFGGMNGFNRFFAKNIHDNRREPNVVLTNFLLFNEVVPVAENRLGGKAKSPQNQYENLRHKPPERQFKKPKTNRGTQYHIAQTIDELDSIRLGYQHSLVTFEFTALDFSEPVNNRYAYKLEGLDRDWIYTDAKHRRATYTNIPSGDYTLRVKAGNQDGYWNEQGKSLQIIVDPAPWKTWWAYTLYALGVALLLMAFVRQERKKVAFERTVNQQLKQVDKLKDEFLANTSHELRTPLNGIIGLTESLLDGTRGELPGGVNNDLQMVVASGRRLANLVNDILDFSKLKNHSLVLNTKPLDLHSMTDVILSLSRPLMGAKGLQLINDVPDDLSPVEADEDRIQQILYNLVGNAIKFTASGSVTVSAIERNGWLKVSISDTGIGIDPDKFAAIFESFEQIEGQDERELGGTGLGLALSKQLVKLHGGRIEVDSIPDKGSVFSFTLPICAPQALQPSDSHPETSQLSFAHKLTPVERLVNTLGKPLNHIETTSGIPHDTQANRQADGKQFRILLVDDEPVNRQVLLNHLGMQNYQLVEASGGQQALDIIALNEPFDLILLDIMMPKVSGYEVCKKLRETWPVHDLPVIFLSAKSQVADLVQSFAVGANDYLTKPVAKHELLTRVKTHLKFLDINRNLEYKVAERTDELKQKHQEVIATQLQLVQAAKMASLGTLTAGVAHEINNPTNFVHVSAQNMEVDLSRFKDFLFELAGDDADQSILDSFVQQFKPLYGHMETIQKGTERIKLIVQDLKIFSQLDGAVADKKVVDISDCLQSSINLVQSNYLKVAVFVTEFTDDVELDCYPAQLNQVFMSLMVNACDAIMVKQQQSGVKDLGRIVIGCRRLEDALEVTVEDNGCGMTEQTKNKLFEPFYTTKEVGSNTGVGLSISYGVVQKHGGELTVESTLNSGSVFTLRLPFNPGPPVF